MDVDLQNHEQKLLLEQNNSPLFLVEELSFSLSL